MLSFDPTEEQGMVVGAVAELARARISAAVREAEAARQPVAQVLSALREMAVDGAALPEAWGGQGLGLLTAIMIEEELAAADASLGFALGGFSAYATFAQALVDDPQRARALVGPVLDGSRVGAVGWSEFGPRREGPGLATRALRRDAGFELDGEKHFVALSGQATDFLVVAQLDADRGFSGLAAFHVEASAPGVRQLGRHATLGLDAAEFGAVAFDGVRLPASALLAAGEALVGPLLRAFARHALHVAARQLGLARQAFELMRSYAELRQAFGKPIGHFQAVAFTLADRHMEIESARELVRRAAWGWDAGKAERSCLGWSAQAVATAHEVAMRAADDCVQLHGGAGFIRDVVAEKLMRDTKQLALCAATAEQMDQLSAAIELDAALDPALVLPTPDTQAVFT
jgi:butyryl-CoA dehydrogenase